jgi:general nucleoside transport system ATP-binding protein
MIGEVPMPSGPLGVDAIAMTMRFGEFVALDNVELKVRPGSMRCSAKTAPARARW